MKLKNWGYCWETHPGWKRDQWKLNGEVSESPIVSENVRTFVDTPKELIFKTDGTPVLTCKNGKVYHLENCVGDMEKQLEYITKDIERGLPIFG
jgi:hypothetical protein